MLFQSKTCLYY